MNKGFEFESWHICLLGNNCDRVGGRAVASNTSGQSYKHFMLVNYDSRIVIWGIFQSGTTLES